MPAWWRRAHGRRAGAAGRARAADAGRRRWLRPLHRFGRYDRDRIQLHFLRNRACGHGARNRQRDHRRRPKERTRAPTPINHDTPTSPGSWPGLAGYRMGGAGWLGLPARQTLLRASTLYL